MNALARIVIAIASAGLLGVALARPLPAQTFEFEPQEATDSQITTDDLLELLEGIVDDGTSQPAVLGDIDLERASASDRRAYHKLKRTRLSVELSGSDIPSMLRSLGKLAGVAITISPKARRLLEQEAPELDFTVRNLSAENVLDLLALQLGEYRFTLRYGVVLLLHESEYRPRQVFRIYNVQDIVRPRRNFPAPRLGLGDIDDTRRP